MSARQFKSQRSRTTKKGNENPTQVLKPQKTKMWNTSMETFNQLIDAYVKDKTKVTRPMRFPVTRPL